MNFRLLSHKFKNKKTNNQKEKKMISNMTRFTVVALALLTSMPSISAKQQQCNPTAGYQYCAAQGCVRGWEKSTKEECCKELKGFEWQSFVGGHGGACVVKKTPKPVPAPVVKKDCGVGTGMQYCHAQGCVHPWDKSTNEQCCEELKGYRWNNFLGGNGGVCKAARRLRGADSKKCNPTAGYQYCAAQGCVRGWEKSTKKECCEELKGYEWQAFVGGPGGACVGKEKPNPAPAPVVKKDCGVGTGMQYCHAQGCVHPWESSTTKKCCHELKGYTWQKFVGGPGGQCVAK